MPRGRPKSEVPSYRLHKASGQAIVTLDGATVYLGAHDSRESRDKYRQVIGEWIAHRGERARAWPRTSRRATDPSGNSTWS